MMLQLLAVFADHGSYQWHELYAPANAPNIGLFFVGLGGVIAAVFTLLAINKQANLMEGQLAEMKAARDVESTILVLQYRPKIIVRGAIAFDFNCLEIGEPAKGTARFTVRNIGGTAARITECLARMFTAEAGAQIELKEGEEVDIGQFALQPGQEIQIERVLTTGAINSIEWEAFYRGERTDPYKILYLTGTIRYLDDLDIPRQTSFYRSYDAKERKFIPSKNTDDEYTD